MTKTRDFPLHIEIEGKKRNMRMYIADCLHVDHFESTLILVRTRANSLRIGGRGLALSLFEDGGVEICGEIREVSLLYAK